MGSKLLRLFLFITHLKLIYTDDYTCTDGEDCIITSNTFQNFYQSTIICPSGYACDITCSDGTTTRTDSYQSCQETIIDASSSSQVIIKCSGLENCKNLSYI